MIDEHDLHLNVEDRSHSTYIIRVNDHPIGKVQSYKYLGVIISSDLSWGNHVSI